MSEHVTDEQLSLLIDGELSLTSRESVSRHLSACPGCAARHDALIELVASLRLQAPLDWNPTETAHTLVGLRQPRRRGWVLPLLAACSLASITTATSLFWLTLGAQVTRGSVSALAALVPGGLPLSTTHSVLLLTGLALLGLLAYPLARTR